jgi:hypothetical protein
MPPTPGYKTTEFWLSLLATILGTILASGVLNPADPMQAKVIQVAGIVLAMLSTLGYTAGRSFVKGQAAKPADLQLVPGLDREAGK